MTEGVRNSTEAERKEVKEEKEVRKIEHIFSKGINYTLLES